MIIPGKSRSITPPIGVIDSLASGLETVATYLPLLLLPLLLDVILWLGPRVSFRPLLVWLGDSVTGRFDSTSLLTVLGVMYLGFPLLSLPELPFPSHQGTWEPIVMSLVQKVSKSSVSVVEALRHSAQSAPDQYLSLSVMPSIVAGRDARPIPFSYIPPVWQVHTPGEALGLRLLFLVAGLVLGAVYLALIAQRIKEGRITLGWVIRRAPATLIQVIIVTIVLLTLAGVAVLMLSLALSAIVVLGSMIGGNEAVGFLATLVMALVFLTVIWVALLTVFTVHGMLMNDRNVLAAMWDSLRVVQWNISSTLGLFLVILVVTMATHYVREWLDPGSWLMPIGMVANAFISTGLVAATFVFYKDRYRYWRELRDQLLAELERRRMQQTRA